MLSKPAETKNKIKTTMKKGLTWRSLLALVFAIAIIQPAMIYYNLITNAVLPVQAWIVILLWTQLARSFGAPLRKQEIFLLLAFQQMSITYALYFVEPLKGMYYLTDPITSALGIAQHAPSWWAPGPADAVRLMSSPWVFLDPVWIAPLALRLLMVVFTLAANISMGYFAHAIYVRSEKLEFPQATALAETVTTLAEREPTQTRALMLSALAGIVYSFAIDFLPFFLGPFFISGGAAYVPVPSQIARPVDFTPLIAQRLPGFSFSVNLNVVPYIVGLLIPVQVSAAQLVGAISCYSIGTYLITRFGLWPPESPYSTSWPTSLLISRSQLYFYTSVAIGLSLAAALMPIILRPRRFIQAFRPLLRVGAAEDESSETPSLRLLLFVFLSACLGAAATTYLTVPQFPVWISILYTVGGSFLFSFVATNAAGVTFSSPNIPYQTELVIYYSGYQQKDIWFGLFPGGAGVAQSRSIGLFTGGPGIAQNFKIADAVDASRTEFVKTYILVVILGLAGSFIFISVLWNIAPIPSGAYPSTITQWPVDATTWARTTEWVWSGYLFRTDWILGSLLIGSAVYAVSTLLFNAPFFLIAFISGMWAPAAGVGGLGVSGDIVSNALAIFIGSILANEVLIPFLGRKVFSAIRGRVVIGFSVGVGFMGLMRSTLVLIGRSRWILPF